MKIERAIKVIQTEQKCVSRQQCDRDCAKCDLVMKDTDILEAYDMAISALHTQQETKKIEILRPHPTEAIVLKLSFREIGFRKAKSMFNTIKSQFPENVVIAIPDDVSLMSCSKDSLENIISMIAETINRL